jgi:hypothetical protein
LNIEAARRTAAARFSTPKQAEAGTVPAQECLRLYDLQDRLPIGHPGSQQQQRKAIARGEAGRLGLTVQDGQLLAEEGIFREQVGTGARQVSQGTGEGVGERRAGDAAEKLMSHIGETIPEAFGTMDELSEHDGVCFS